MYARVEGERELTFQVSGMLWQRSLVMKDLETGSLWSHLLGEAMRGELKGTRLEMLPAAMTTWKEWRQRHPKTTVLAMSRTAREFDAEIWNHPGPFVFGVPLGAGRDGPAVSIEKLMSVHVMNLQAGGNPILVTFADAGNRAQAFDPSLDGEVARFETAGQGRMKDTRTGSLWDAVTGVCLHGVHKGKKLAPRPGTISYRKAWRAFFPKAEVAE
ncbi:MAG: DUF3179 domain-containing protein [Akkermansiaceae bacterium]|nr:DUF3179 domain-containing protein [Akkermansiaceae bacterium]